MRGWKGFISGQEKLQTFCSESNSSSTIQRSFAVLMLGLTLDNRVVLDTTVFWNVSYPLPHIH